MSDEPIEQPTYERRRAATSDDDDASCDDVCTIRTVAPAAGAGARGAAAERTTTGVWTAAATRAPAEGLYSYCFGKFGLKPIPPQPLYYTVKALAAPPAPRSPRAIVLFACMTEAFFRVKREL